MFLYIGIVGLKRGCEKHMLWFMQALECTTSFQASNTSLCCCCALPVNKADRRKSCCIRQDKAFCDVVTLTCVWFRYDLHVLLVNHGKRCPRCAKNGKPRKASDGDCPLFGTKTVKEILKKEPNQDSGSEATVKPDPASDSDVVVKEDPDGDSEMKVKADLIKDPGSKKRQKGSKGSTVGNEASGGNDNVKQEASGESSAIKPDPDIKLEPSQT